MDEAQQIPSIERDGKPSAWRYGCRLMSKQDTILVKLHEQAKYQYIKLIEGVMTDLFLTDIC
jgi:hypothetical protein